MKADKFEDGKIRSKRQQRDSGFLLFGAVLSACLAGFMNILTDLALFLLDLPSKPMWYAWILFFVVLVVTLWLLHSFYSAAKKAIKSG
ncbi:MAG: hypothetical protein Q8Q12_01700 [bacterium]|nr:hypothetical protein [bacterium]